MRYLASTAHKQFLGLMMGVVAWILTMATAGLNEWRLWYVEDTSVVTSGVAWVGIWRACFYSHAMPQFEFCEDMHIWAGFVPAEIRAAQVLMVLAVTCGLTGNVGAAYAMRMAYFSLERRDRLGLAFSVAGSLYIATGVCSLVPLSWNVHSVLTNRSIDFPPEFHLPAAPVEQGVGSAVCVGFTASALIVTSGLLFLCYRSSRGTAGPGTEQVKETTDPHRDPWTLTTASGKAGWQGGSNGLNRGTDNPAFSL